jgi:hypothetical protein
MAAKLSSLCTGSSFGLADLIGAIRESGSGHAFMVPEYVVTPIGTFVLVVRAMGHL